MFFWETPSLTSLAKMRRILKVFKHRVYLLITAAVNSGRRNGFPFGIGTLNLEGARIGRIDALRAEWSQ